MESGVIEVVVEIPKGSRNKYEYDHERNIIRLDRRLLSATTYPADYGFIPDTLAGDGDPPDAMILCEDATFPRLLGQARPAPNFGFVPQKVRNPTLMWLRTTSGAVEAGAQGRGMGATSRAGGSALGIFWM